jgi:hypothetical protein
MNACSGWPRLSTLLAALLLSAVACAADGSADPSSDGLQLVEQDHSGEIYADPDVDWASYSQIQLLDATVAFRKNWQRDQNRSYPFKVKADDMQRIRTTLAELFREIFTEELTADRAYVLSEHAGDEVLTIKPAIIDLDVYAPDTMQAARSDQYTESAGRMTLKLELHDSVTGALLARASDRREAFDYNYLRWTTSVTNKAEAQRMLRQWAKELRRRLDQARAHDASGANSSPE